MLLKMRLLFFAALVVLTPFGHADAQPKPDPCRALLPSAISQLITRRFSEYRLPLVSDGDPDIVKFEKDKGNSGCIVVAEGDFNGDKKKDFAVGLTPTTAKTPTVAIALSKGTTWDLSNVESWVDSAQRLYVNRARPGPEPGTNERELLRCRTDAVIVGATESTGIAYCYVNNRWLYVWISD